MATASWPNRTEPGGSQGLDDYLVRDFHRSIGAEIMGRNKFGPQRGPWPDEDWKGWWGEGAAVPHPRLRVDPPPAVLVTLADTTFHFVSGDPAEVLSRARDAALGQDVRLGGGAQTICAFLDADLVDTLHVAVAPVELGSGSRLWNSPSDLDDRFHRDEVPSPAASSTTCSGAGSRQLAELLICKASTAPQIAPGMSASAATPAFRVGEHEPSRPLLDERPATPIRKPSVACGGEGAVTF